MDKRKKIWILGAVSAASFAGWLISLTGGTWDNLGAGTWRNSLITFSAVALLVSFTWLMVAYTKYDTPKGNLTPWKRVGKTALITWGALLAAVLISFIGVPVISGLMGTVQLALIPSALTFPIWTVIAAIRGKRAPEMQTATALQVRGDTFPFTPEPDKATPPTAEAPSPKPINSRALIAVIALSGVLAAGALLWLGDQWMRSQELNSILNTIEKTEVEMVASNSITVQGLDLYTSMQNHTGMEEAQSLLLVALTQSGSELAIELKVLEDEWESINILPWHSDLANFKDDYTDHLNSWIATGEFYESVTNVEDYFNSPNSSDISATFRIAGASGENLSIPIFASNAEKRIETIFRD
jgi:hypothetical protein